jgi:hypothetical protein
MTKRAEPYSINFICSGDGNTSPRLNITGGRLNIDPADVVIAIHQLAKLLKGLPGSRRLDGNVTPPVCDTPYGPLINAIVDMIGGEVSEDTSYHIYSERPDSSTPVADDEEAFVCRVYGRMSNNSRARLIRHLIEEQMKAKGSLYPEPTEDNCDCAKCIARRAIEKASSKSTH